ncbi:hypothetical protein [Dyadobacter sp. CY312]|uniref:hypothetical protein n=1 Tax=Dyadobacter sp. CY312 TaxID=2907303 RepID=UPI001F23515B|nr:hypothetical protein [Dyadobacter sp. CY312]MCE7040666.1 hypothetical protein [Dyadobacter sp. CY312]
MKKIFILTCISIFGVSGILKAQFTGKQYIGGEAAVNFNNSDLNNDRSVNNYGYNFDISLGKFQSETRATGWNLSTSLSGAKNFYQLDDTGIPIERKGINRVGVGVGRFWQFYKHFNNNVGIFAGPGVNLGFSASKELDNQGGTFFYDVKRNQINLSLGLAAGVYYKFSDKWWATASLAFANPISVEYVFAKYKALSNIDAGFKRNELKYQFNPGINLPSVGLGVRYFYNR